ncbi:MAG: NAD-dependent protein deacylase, partial [Clostridia bacterium]|nr:NAD-dependent protein deacylase [Clostridia bacterium]
MDGKIERLRELIDGAENIVFFGGAGVSTESGVPDFRSKDGLYNQHDVRFDAYRPEYLLSHTCLVREPAVFFEFYRQKMDARGVQPNAAHYALAKLEREGKLKAIVTQNIDGLHQKAGSRTVWEIHGTTERNYCMRCGKPY